MQSTVNTELWSISTEPLILRSVCIDGRIHNFAAHLSITQSYLTPQSIKSEDIFEFELPLYDLGVVTGFEVNVGSERTVANIIKKEDVLSEISFGPYLHLNSTDLFLCKLRDARPGEKVDIKISFITDLHLDGESLRLVIPPTVTPRLYQYEKDDPKSQFQLSLNIILDMFEVGKIKTVRSPSHSIQYAKKKSSPATIKLKNGSTSKDTDIFIFIEFDKPISSLLPCCFFETSNDSDSKYKQYHTAAMITMIPTFDVKKTENKNPKELLLVVDCFKWDNTEHVKIVMDTALQQINNLDMVFNVVILSNPNYYLFQTSKKATSSKIMKAQKFIASEEFSNYISTASISYLTGSLKELYFSYGELIEENSRNIFLLSNGLVSRASELLAFIDDRASDFKIFPFAIGTSGNSYVLRTMGRLTAGYHELAINMNVKSDKFFSELNKKVSRQIQRILQPQINITSMDWGKVNDHVIQSAPQFFFLGELLIIYGFLPELPSVKTKFSLRAEFFNMNKKLDFSVPINPSENVWNDQKGILHIQAATELIIQLDMEGEEVGNMEALQHIYHIASYFGISSGHTSFWGNNSEDAKNSILLVSCTDLDIDECSEEDENGEIEQNSDYEQVDDSVKAEDSGENLVKLDQNEQNSNYRDINENGNHEKEILSKQENENKRKYEVDYLLTFKDLHKDIPDGFNAAFHGLDPKIVEKYSNSSLSWSGRGGKNRNNRNQFPRIQSPRPKKGLNIKKQWDNVNDDLFKEINSLLNKLSEKNFQIILGQILAKKQDIKSDAILRGFVDLIFEKAVCAPSYSTIYANLCLQLKVAIAQKFQDTKNGDIIDFRRCLINKCQDEFETKSYEIPTIKTIDSEEILFIKRKRNQGTISFVGELYLQGILGERTIHRILREMLHIDDFSKIPDDQSIELAIKLILTVGKKLSDQMDTYFVKIKEMSTNSEIESRIRFLLMGLIDLRGNNWEKGKGNRNCASPKKNDDVENTRQDVNSQRRAVQSSSGSGNKKQQMKNSSRQNIQSSERWSPSKQNIRNNGNTRILRDRDNKQRGNRSNRYIPEFREKQNHGNVEISENPIKIKESPSEEEEEDGNNSKSGNSVQQQQPQLSKECVEKLVEQFLKEYLDALDLENAVSCFRDINSELTPFETSYKALCLGLESSENDRKLLASLLQDFSTQYKLISTQNIFDGLKEVLNIIEDIKLDIPKATEFLGFFFCFFYCKWNN